MRTRSPFSRLVLCLTPVALFAACEAKGPAPSAPPPAADSGTQTSTTAKKGVLRELTFGPGPIARVNGVEIPRSAFETYYNRFRISTHRFPILYSEGSEQAVLARVTKRLITEEIIRQQAKAAGVTAPEAKVNALLEDIRARMSRDAEYAEYHRQLGTKEEVFRNEAEVDVLRDELVDRTLRQAREVPEAEIKAAYEAQKERFRHPEQVQLSRIRFDIGSGMSGDQIGALKARAEASHAALKKGAKFDALAREVSDGSTREKGGELGWLARGTLPDHITEAVWKLKPGAISEVLGDERGFYIFKVHAFRKEGVEPLADVRPQLYAQLKQQRQAEALTKELLGWREAAKVEVLVPELEAAMTRTSTVMPEIPDRDPELQPVKKQTH